MVVMENLDGTKTLIPDDLKLECITEESARRIAGNPEAIADYINHLIIAYNDRVDDINEYYRLYNETSKELNELLEHPHTDDDILGLMGDNDELS